MCSSRIYLGMHSLADIVVGLILAVLLLFIVLPIGKFLADIFSVFGPFFLFFKFWFTMVITFSSPPPWPPL